MSRPAHAHTPSARRGFAACLLLLTSCHGNPAPEGLLLVSVDTLRADRLGAYGSDLGATPHIDALAAESLVFSDAYAPSSATLPSLAALLSGRYPEALGIRSNASAVPQGTPTLATALRERGWRTAAVVSNYVLRPSAGLSPGFEHYDDTMLQRERVRKWPERIAADTTDAALQALDGLTGAGAPWFLWVHYQDPHGPYTPPPGYRERFLEREGAAADADRLLEVQPGHAELGAIPTYQLVDQRRDVAFYRAGYDGEVGYLDVELGRLLDGLRRRGLYETTLIVFAADHGEGLGEGDYWFAHGEYLSEPLVRVPLLIRRPGAAPGRREDLASLVDLFPTLHRLLLGEAAGADYAGRDLLSPTAEDERAEVYLANLGAVRVARRGILDDDYRFVISFQEGVWDAELHRRGREDVDLSAPAPQLAADMRRRLMALHERVAPERPEVRQRLDPEERRNLRALGYLEAAPEPTP